MVVLGLPLVVVASFGGCSSTDPGAAATDDGGGEGEAAIDTGAPDTATCNLSANLLDTIPDASIADGASTTGLCLGCVQASCSTMVKQCNASCDCQGAVSSGLACYLKNINKPTACLAALAVGNIDESVKTIGLGLLSCVNTSCKEVCSTASLPDSGPP
jgi:hypothetical protein